MSDVTIGRYLMLSHLHRGEATDIYRARVGGAFGFEKLVAIKRLSLEHAQDEAVRRRFIRQAVLGSKLCHHNVVGIYDFHEDGDELYLAMELVDCVSLKSILEHQRRTGQPFPLQAVLTISFQLLDGLEYLHKVHDPLTGRRLELVHRDLSPANVLVDRSGVVKLTGLDRAQVREDAELLEPGVRITPYAPPEVLEGAHEDATSDLYSLGALMFEMLSLEPLLLGNGASELQAELARLDLEARLESLPAPSPSLRQILRKALAPRPSERFQSAQAMSRELRPLLWEVSSGQPPDQVIREAVESARMVSEDHSSHGWEGEAAAGVMIEVSSGWSPWGSNSARPFSIEQDYLHGDLDLDEEFDDDEEFDEELDELELEEDPGFGGDGRKRRGATRTVNLAMEPWAHLAPPRGAQEGLEAAGALFDAIEGDLEALSPDTALESHTSVAASATPEGETAELIEVLSLEPGAPASEAADSGSSESRPEASGTGIDAEIASDRESAAEPTSGSGDDQAVTTAEAGLLPPAWLDSGSASGAEGLPQGSLEPGSSSGSEGLPQGWLDSGSASGAEGLPQGWLDSGGPSGAEDLIQGWPDPGVAPGAEGLTQGWPDSGTASGPESLSGTWPALEDATPVAPPAPDWQEFAAATPTDSALERPSEPRERPELDGGPVSVPGLESGVEAEEIAPEIETTGGGLRDLQEVGWDPGGSIDPLDLQGFRSATANTIEINARQAIAAALADEAELRGERPEATKTTSAVASSSEPAVWPPPPVSGLTTLELPLRTLAAAGVPARVFEETTAGRAPVDPEPVRQETPLFDGHVSLPAPSGSSQPLEPSDASIGPVLPFAENTKDVSRPRFLDSDDLAWTRTAAPRTLPTISTALPARESGLEESAAELTTQSNVGDLARRLFMGEEGGQESTDEVSIELIEEYSGETLLESAPSEAALPAAGGRPTATPASPAEWTDATASAPGDLAPLYLEEEAPTEIQFDPGPGVHRAQAVAAQSVTSSTGFAFLLLSQNPGTRLAIPEAGMTIGRAHSNDLVLADLEVAPRHARVVWEGGRWWLRAQRGETLKIDGHVASEAPVEPGHVLEIGHTRFTVVTNEPETPVGMVDYRALEAELISRFPNAAREESFRAAAGLPLRADLVNAAPRAIWSDALNRLRSSPDPRPLRRLLDVLVELEPDSPEVHRARDCLRVIERWS